MEEYIMKKLACLFALFVLIGLIFTSCKSTETSSDNKTGETENVKISKNISDYITETDNKKYIVLPKSKVKVHIQEEYITYVDKIDVDLLISAEEKISKQIKEYSNKSGLYLDVWEDYLCLSAEVIVELEPDLVEGESGAIFDHEHKFFRERITKEKLGME
jgi:tetrahydromethanopterin S-methyltransferase subunit A